MNEPIKIEITSPETAAIVAERFEDSEAGRACYARVVAGIAAPYVALIHELYQHLDYCGWGDAWERQVVIEPGGLRDRTIAALEAAGVKPCGRN